MSLEIPSGIILLWPGSNGSIPSGFTRETDLDDKFPVGAANGAGAGATGGGNSHSHGTTHNHGGTSHTHSSTIPANTGNYRMSTYNPSWRIPSGVDNPSSTHDHTHTWTSSPGATGNWSAGGAFGGGGADPSYYNMVFIKSDGSPESYPANCVVMRNDSSGVSGWTQHSGSKSRYIQGAGSGGNGGGTGGGGHTHSLGSHGHSFGGHGHSQAANTGPASATELVNDDSEDAYNEPQSHYHPFKVSVAPWTGATSSGSASALTSSNVTQAPNYRYMWGLENTSGGTEAEGMIVLWNDSIANIPEDWLLCDGSNGTPDLRDRFLRMANSSGEVGGTGGANSHSHSGGSHSHSAGGTHNHLVNWYPWPSYAIGWTPWGSGGSDAGTRHPSYHTTGNLAYSAFSTGSAGPFPCPSTTASINSVDARPPYRTVLYLFSPEGEAAGGNVGMFGSNF